MSTSFTRRVHSRTLLAPAALLSATLLSGCGGTKSDAPARGDSPRRTAGTTFTVHDIVIPDGIDVAGVAEPVRQATLATKLMGTVTAVRVHEGDVVHTGQILLTIDSRELAARSMQVSASIADAEALQAEAARQAGRMRALYADSAATRAQFDAAETGLARADASLRSARATSGELDAVRNYASVRAPFTGIVTARLADPGTFAAPGSLLLTVQDVSILKITASAGADVLSALRRGTTLQATIGGDSVTATVEAVVPSAVGNLFTVSATVPNPGSTRRAGSSAILRIPGAARHALLVPSDAIVRDGDLTGVVVYGASRDERRWVRLGTDVGNFVIVTSGLRAGETIVVPAAP